MYNYFPVIRTKEEDVRFSGHSSHWEQHQQLTRKCQEFISSEILAPEFISVLQFPKMVREFGAERIFYSISQYIDSDEVREFFSAEVLADSARYPKVFPQEKLEKKYYVYLNKIYELTLKSLMDELSNAYVIKIFQLLTDIDSKELRFADYDSYIKESRSPLKSTDYLEVMDTRLMKEKEPMEVLDDLYMILNKYLPINYIGRSLSIGDIVNINKDFYYVDTVGFKQLNTEAGSLFEDLNSFIHV